MFVRRIAKQADRSYAKNKGVSTKSLQMYCYTDTGLFTFDALRVEASCIKPAGSPAYRSFLQKTTSTKAIYMMILEFRFKVALVDRHFVSVCALKNRSGYTKPRYKLPVYA